MREILFRGKRLDNGEWVYGNLLCFPNGYCLICTLLPNSNLINQYGVAPATVGQYTGIEDKNGQKIFEGDIVRIITANIDEEEQPFVTIWVKDMAAFGFINDTLCITYDNFYSYEVEVIGNIHDNPELLGEEALEYDKR